MFAASAIAGAAFSVRRLSRRSGVEFADLTRPLPGDDIIAETSYIADRGAVIPATPEQVWPWLVQLGKGRGGWYFPSRMEPLLIPRRTSRGARTLLPEFQQLSVGDVVEDWGPGMLEVLTLEPNRLLIYGSVKAGDRPGDHLFSWVHLLEPLGDDVTRLHTRLRIRPSARRFLTVFTDVLGLFDWATMALMHAGLRENVTRGNWANSGSTV